jgi:LacI family transcriptional regulator
MTLAKNGMSLNSEYVTENSKSDDCGDTGGHEAMSALLRLTPRPDGVFCYNDPMAMGAMRAILDAGLRVPADIAIVGCGNVHYADFLRVPLSSIDQNTQALGTRAAKLALRIIKNKSNTTRSILLPAKLVVRASSKTTAPNAA